MNQAKPTDASDQPICLSPSDQPTLDSDKSKMQVTAAQLGRAPQLEFSRLSPELNAHIDRFAAQLWTNRLAYHGPRLRPPPVVHLVRWESGKPEEAIAAGRLIQANWLGRIPKCLQFLWGHSRVPCRTQWWQYRGQPNIIIDLDARTWADPTAMEREMPPCVLLSLLTGGSVYLGPYNSIPACPDLVVLATSKPLDALYHPLVYQECDQIWEGKPFAQWLEDTVSYTYLIREGKLESVRQGHAQLPPPETATETPTTWTAEPQVPCTHQ
jgi:hypothetical protein